MTETITYAEGDWIVHSHFGIGQIEGTEIKDISGEETHYFRIKATDSIFWVPVKQMDSELVRPLSSHEEIEQAIATLQNQPNEMSSNYKVRQSRIRTAQLSNTPKAIARIIRDLRALQKAKGVLNQTERNAFRTLKQRLAEEWALIMGINTEKAASKLDNLLEPQQASAD